MKATTISRQTQAQFDPDYETTRIADENAFYRKLCVKRWLHRFVGEIYIGKRAKLAHFRRWIHELELQGKLHILEVGSGDGLFCFEAAKMLPDSQIIGMELNAAEARACKKRAQVEGIDNLDFVQGLLQDFSWTSKFDFLFCLDVLEHIKDDMTAVREMAAVLKPGGKLLVHVPSRFFQDIDGSMHTVADEDAWRINPGHVRNGYTKDELHALLCGANLSVQEIAPTQGPPIAHAHRIYRRVEGVLPLRVIVLPWIDRLIREDLRTQPDHGNTLWALAEKSA